MCGRYLLDTEIREIIKTYKIQRREVEAYGAGDIHPSTYAPIVFDTGQRIISDARWGFPLDFKKGIVINARSESIMSKPIFRDSFYTSRCIIPANLYYEWKDEGGKKKVKYGIGMQDGCLISLGGIFKTSLDEDGDPTQKMTFVIITTAADKDIKSIHSRMPLIIKDGAIDAWLDKNADVEHIKEILRSNVDNNFTIKRFENESGRGSHEDDYQQIKMF